MGTPTPRDPWNSEASRLDPFAVSPIATTDRPGENREAPKKPATTLDDLAKRAKKIESEPNAEAADAIRRLRGSKKTAEQLEGLTYLRQALNSVLIKLAKKGVDVLKIASTKQLENEVVINGLKLDLTERVAVENLDRVASEKGETSDDIKKNWPATLSAAKESSKGLGDKYKE
jgi:hypothetical protein